MGPCGSRRGVGPATTGIGEPVSNFSTDCTSHETKNRGEGRGYSPHPKEEINFVTTGPLISATLSRESFTTAGEDLSDSVVSRVSGLRPARNESFRNVSGAAVSVSVRGLEDLESSDQSLCLSVWLVFVVY